MIYTMIITEIDTRVYAAMLNFHDCIFTNCAVCDSARDAEATFKQRFWARRINWATSGKCPHQWTKGVDQIQIEWKNTRAKSECQENIPTGRAEPKLYELVKNDNVYKVIKHDKELLTESEVKLEMFKSAVNG